MTPQTMAGANFGVGVLGSAIAGFGQIEAGQNQKSADDYNADITLDNMRNQMVENTEKFSALVGRQGTAYSAAGVDIASGSPLLVMAATAGRGAQQGEQIREAGTQAAALQRYYGKIAAWSGTMGGIGSFLSGLSKSAAGYNSATSNPSASSGVPTAPNAMFGSLFAGVS
jgi:hypothetical protein